MAKGHDWANPGPAGLVALAMACFVFYALLTGKVTAGVSPLMGIWLLGGFVVQLCVGLIELKEGNSTGGNVFTFFSAFFMLVTGLELILKFFAATNGWKIDARIDGWAWLALAIALTTWTPAYFKSPLTLCAVVVALDPALWIISLADMGAIARTPVPIAGVFLLIAGIFGLYTAAGVILNTEFGRTILPLGAPLIKPAPPSTTASH
ncbi:acetate uptake transporter family protein [Desulfotomaculum copahuensis]|nr:GPR1/FUN34/YaaH family transporter [Desulfotomaculum copahuensis]